MDVIRIKNAQFYAYHGAAEGEQSLGGKFEVDVDLRCDLSQAKNTDDLQHTVDYEKVHAVIQQAVTVRKYHLLEALANAVAGSILESFGRVAEVTVAVRKPHAPVKGVVDYVEVQINRSRQ